MIVGRLGCCVPDVHRLFSKRVMFFLMQGLLWWSWSLQRARAYDSRFVLLALEPLADEYLVEDQHAFVIFLVEWVFLPVLSTPCNFRWDGHDLWNRQYKFFTRLSGFERIFPSHLMEGSSWIYMRSWLMRVFSGVKLLNFPPGAIVLFRFDVLENLGTFYLTGSCLRLSMSFGRWIVLRLYGIFGIHVFLGFVYELG